MLDRRRFLQVGALSPLALSGLSLVARADKISDTNPFGDFKIGAQSYTFREFNTEQALDRMKKLGLHYGEFYQKHIPLNSTPAQIKAFLKLCADYDVKPLAWGVQGFTKKHDDNKRVFEFGSALGIKMFSANPDPDAFDSLDKLCDECKIAIGIHPHGPVGGGKLDRWYSAEIILAAVKDHNKLIGSCLDTGHLIRSAQLGKELDPVRQIKLMGARNFGIHLKDHDNKAHTDVVFGKGKLDVPGVLAALKEVKFDGLISIEYEAHPADPSPDVRACLEVVKEAVKKV
jgi:sugar phosphate isomerase/epimerase